MNFKKSFFLLFIFVYSFEVKAQTAEKVIANYLLFIGGEQKWQSVHSLVDTGIYNYGGIEFPFKSYSRAPDLYKFIVPFNGKYYAQAFNGKTGWKIDAFKNQTTKTILKGKSARAMANEADVEIENPFINYKHKGFQAELEGKDSIEQTECFKIKFTRKNGAVENYFFDTGTYSLLKKQAVAKNEEMANKILDTYYSDYREINGLKIPFKATSKSDGQTVLTITIVEVKINIPIPDADFQ